MLRRVARLRTQANVDERGISLASVLPRRPRLDRGPFQNRRDHSAKVGLVGPVDVGRDLEGKVSCAVLLLGSDYIERFYNPKRRHSTLGYLSPMEFEMNAHELAGHRHLDRVNRQREEPDVQWKAATFAL